jgi:phenylpropionate dioxygenase-like ring-hydroxylating dioxygenase large terminal subunit
VDCALTHATDIAFGYDIDPSRSKSLIAEAYTQQKWFNADLKEIVGKTWQWVCHVEKTREPGAYVTDPDPMEIDAIRYLDEVLQVEDIGLVESVQRGMSTPAFTQGRIVNDPSGSGKSEHAVHHFHGLVLDAYAGAVS